MRTRLLRCALCAAALGLAAGSTRADPVYESATLGATGQLGGLSIDEDQFVGSRFHLAEAKAITAVGGHLDGDSTATIFAAIVATQPGQVPSFAPDQIESFALASTTFAPPDSSADVLAPLSVTLGPGDYALIFGTGRFGAAADGGMPTDNTDTPAGAGSYFFSFGGSDVGGGWSNYRNPRGGLRFVVEGRAVPEPASLTMLGVGAAGLIGYVRRRRQAATA